MGKGEDDDLCATRGAIALLDCGHSPAAKWDRTTPAVRRRWTEARLGRELRFEADKLGHWPTADELRSIGRADLVTATQRSGGFNTWARKLGYEPNTKQKWDEERVAAELTALVENAKGPVLVSDLAQSHPALYTAMAQYGGGRRAWVDRFGLVRKQTLWSDELIEHELRAFIAERARTGQHAWPTKTEFAQAGRTALRCAIRDQGGPTVWAPSVGLQPRSRGHHATTKA